MYMIAATSDLGWHLLWTLSAKQKKKIISLLDGYVDGFPYQSKVSIWRKKTKQNKTENKQKQKEKTKRLGKGHAGITLGQPEEFAKKWSVATQFGLNQWPLPIDKWKRKTLISDLKINPLRTSAYLETIKYYNPVGDAKSSTTVYLHKYS